LKVPAPARREPPRCRPLRLRHGHPGRRRRRLERRQDRLQIGGARVGHKPRQRLAVELDGAREAGSDEQVGQDEVGVQLEAGVVEDDINPSACMFLVLVCFG
jgi:hypothetical protein